MSNVDLFFIITITFFLGVALGSFGQKYKNKKQ